MMKFVCDTELIERMINNRGWLFVIFFSRFSIPCDQFLLEVRRLSDELWRSAMFLGLDVDENPTKTAELTIFEFPTTVILKGPNAVARYAGPYSREALLARFKELRKVHR